MDERMKAIEDERQYDLFELQPHEGMSMDEIDQEVKDAESLSAYREPMTDE